MPKQRPATKQCRIPPVAQQKALGQEPAGLSQAQGPAARKALAPAPARGGVKSDEAKSRMVGEVEMVARASAFLAASARAQGPGRGATMQALARRLDCHLGHRSPHRSLPPLPPPLPEGRRPNLDP